MILITFTFYSLLTRFFIHHLHYQYSDIITFLCSWYCRRSWTITYVLFPFSLSFFSILYGSPPTFYFPFLFLFFFFLQFYMALPLFHYHIGGIYSHIFNSRWNEQQHKLWSFVRGFIPNKCISNYFRLRSWKTFLFSFAIFQSTEAQNIVLFGLSASERFFFLLEGGKEGEGKEGWVCICIICICIYICIYIYLSIYLSIYL